MTRADGFVWMKDSSKVKHFERRAAKYAKLGRKHVARKYRRKAEAQAQIDLQQSRLRFARLVDRTFYECPSIFRKLQILFALRGGMQWLIAALKGGEV